MVEDGLSFSEELMEVSILLEIGKIIRKDLANYKMSFGLEMKISLPCPYKAYIQEVTYYELI